jgi:hypothetical protein
MSNKKASYGICSVCSTAIIYPGLDGYKCESCGWLKVSEVALTLKKAAALAERTQNKSKANAVGQNSGISKISPIIALDSS